MAPPEDPGQLTVARFQRLIADTFLEKDRRRGLPATFAWLVEEVGEVSRALRSGDRATLAEELSDVLAWAASVANVSGVDLEAALVAKYGRGCSRCGASPCACAEAPAGKGGQSPPPSSSSPASGPLR